MAALSSLVGRGLAPVVLGCGLLGVMGLAVELNSARHRVALATLVACGLSLVAVAWYAQPRPLTSLDRDALHAAFVGDAKLYRGHAQGMAAVVARLDRLGLPPPDDAPLSADQERVLLGAWRELLRYAVALESIRVFHEDYYRLDLDARRDDHVMAFLLTFAADAALFEHAARFSQRVGANDNAEKFLDTPHPGLARSSYSRFREEMLGVRDGTRIRAGTQYLEVARAMLPADAKLRAAGVALTGALDAHIAAIDALGELPAAEELLRAELQRFKRGFSRTWYPIQKKAAEMLGDTRVRRVGRYLIDDDLIAYADEKLRPGDILLSRKNWYLSNVGLPGFWPHAIIYLGAPAELAATFGDAFTGDLEQRFPEAWATYAAADRRVIEAISEGVTFSTMHACAGDYLAGLRPRLPKDLVAGAIKRAFSHFNKPYDFDFDFATGHALVCTELVYRAFRPDGDDSGISLQLTEMAGRSTLPANDIAAQYAREHGTPGAQLDFVLFIDAREKEGRAFVSTEEAFRATHERTQWDISLD